MGVSYGEEVKGRGGRLTDVVGGVERFEGSEKGNFRVGLSFGAAAREIDEG